MFSVNKRTLERKAYGDDKRESESRYYLNITIDILVFVW